MTDLTQYIKTERVIDGIKTVKDLDKAYFVLWKCGQVKLYGRGERSLPRKDKLREKLLGKMREVL